MSFKNKVLSYPLLFPFSPPFHSLLHPPCFSPPFLLFPSPPFQNDFVLNPLGGSGKVDVLTRLEMAELNRGKKLSPWGSRGSPCAMTAWHRVSKRVSLEEVAWNKVLEPDQNVYSNLMEEKFGDKY